MPTIPRFNVDLTGANLNNRVVGEPHALDVKAYRSIAPIYGPYYTESLVVVDASSSLSLIRDVHYKCLDVVGIPTAQTGKEICTIIVITAPTVSNNVIITYQALGGNYEHTHEAIKLLIDNLLIDNRPTFWPSIINRPTGFEPSHHLHRAGDMYGFEYMTVELERLKNAILLGDEIAHMEILSYVDANIDALKLLIGGNDNLVSTVAVSAATDANTAATSAVVTVLDLVGKIQSAINGLNALKDEHSVLVADQISSEAKAIALIQQYS